jgi:hypothetical protein
VTFVVWAALAVLLIAGVAAGVSGLIALTMGVAAGLSLSGSI